jgi:hypothetical protein
MWTSNSNDAALDVDLVILYCNPSGSGGVRPEYNRITRTGHRLESEWKWCWQLALMFEHVSLETVKSAEYQSTDKCSGSNMFI